MIRRGMYALMLSALIMSAASCADGEQNMNRASLSISDTQINMSSSAAQVGKTGIIEGQIGVVDSEGKFRAVTDDRIEKYYRELLNKSGYQRFCKIDIRKWQSDTEGNHHYYLEMKIKDQSINVLSELKQVDKGKYTISGKTIACERAGCPEGEGCMPVVESGFLRCSNCDEDCLNHSISTDEKHLRDFFLRKS